MAKPTRMPDSRTLDWTDREAVIAFAQRIANNSPEFIQYVVKYPTRENYNITMQREKAVDAGASIVWQSGKGG